MVDKRKREARARAAATGESYTRAAREVARGRTGEKAAEQPAATLPAPVAVMVARQLRAAWQHLGAARYLAADHGVPVARPRLQEPEPSALARIMRTTTDDLWDLMDWAGSTAVASCAVAAKPHGFGDVDEKAADAELYPDPLHWCHTPGGVLPQPGERPGEPAAVRERVRHLLRGLPGATRLRARSQGRLVVRAGDVVPGTPSEPIWNAERELTAYTGDWMDRAGDSPADLAAAIDGLTELARSVSDVAMSVSRELRRRAANGTLIGVDAELLTQAHDRLEGVLTPTDDPDAGSYYRIAEPLVELRDTLDAAAAALPAPDGVRVTDPLAKTMAGKTAAQIRHELGHETFLQRHRSKTRPGDYTRADALDRILTWMHTQNRETYQPEVHARHDVARWPDDWEK